MAPLRYWCLRLVRRQVPQPLVEAMLDFGLFLKPGLDTRAPEQSVRQLADSCAGLGATLQDATICVVGYGGSFGIAVALLDAGARHVVLQDPFAPVRHARIRRLGAERLGRYFTRQDGRWIPDPSRITVVTEQLSDYAARHPHSADVVFSSSVFEHVDDVDGLVEACRLVTRPGGANVHAIDLRDHYFRYPFEMLCYSAQTWQRWLGSSNLNRWRLPEYERVFGQHFPGHQTIVTQSLADEFARVKKRIRPEFLSGDDSVDSVGTIRIEARAAA